MITTPRLLLRRHRPDDFPAVLAMWSDPAVTRHIGGKPSTREECWARFLKYFGHWELVGYGYFVIEERASASFVGEVGFGDFRRELEPSIDGAPEIGWALNVRMHGRGYATEAARAALAWGDANFPSPRTVCIIDPGNTASIRVAEKLGYHEVCRTTYRSEPTILYERIRSSTT